MFKENVETAITIYESLKKERGQAIIFDNTYFYPIANLNIYHVNCLTIIIIICL